MASKYDEERKRLKNRSEGTSTSKSPSPSQTSKLLLESHRKTARAKEEAAKRVPPPPSVEKQLRTATTAFTPQSVRKDLRPTFGPPAPEFVKPAPTKTIAARLGLDKPIIGPSVTEIGQAVLTDPLLRGVSRTASLGLGEKAIPERRGEKPFLEKAGEVLGYLQPGTAAERLAASALKPVVKNLPRAGQLASQFAGAGALFGTAQETAQELGGLNDQTLGQRALDVGIETAAGGALGALGDVPRLLRNTGQRAAQDIVSGQLGAARSIQQAGDAVTTGRLKVGGPDTYVNRVMSEISPIVTERITPPLENPNELAKWLQPHLGDTSLNEIRKLPYEDMRQLANEVRSNMNMYDVARSVARERGYNLDDILGGNTPNFKNEVERLRMGRVAGAIDAPQNARLALSNGEPRPTSPATPQAPMNVVEAPAGRVQQPDVLPLQQEAIQPIRSDDAPIGGAVAQPAARTSPRIAGERGFNRTLRESGQLTDEVIEGLAQSPDRRYRQITNKETVQKANDLINRLGVDQAEARLQGKKILKPEDIATGIRLVQELQSGGFVERAVSIAEKVTRKLTEAGQTVQAASILNRLSPEGALIYAQRKVNRINDNLLRGQAEVKITPEQANNITEAAGSIQAAGASQERAGTVMEIMDRVRKGEQISEVEKQTVADFVKDAKRFIDANKTSTRPPRQARAPKELSDSRVRDRVLSFLEEQEQAAKERLRAKGVRISSNPLDIWGDYAVIGAIKLVKGGVKFADWSAQMLDEFGENVRPYLREVYEKSQEMLNTSSKKINDQVISKAERVAEGFIKQKGDQLAQSDVDLIRNMAQKVSALSDQERRLASQDLQAIMQGFEKAGIGRKISAAQYIAMLLNPLTQIRNVVGNEMMYRLERMSKIIGTPIDIVSSKLTGGPRTVTFKSGPKVWDDFFKPAKDYWTSLPQGAKAGARGVSPEGLTSKYEIQGLAFRSKYNPLTYLEKALGASLQGFDYASYTRATNQTMSEMAYLDALNSGIKGKDAIRNHIQTFMTNIDDATHSIAKDYGKFVTLQDDSVLASSIMGFRRGANKLTTGSPDFGAGSLVVPFAKTPANLLLRGIDYSPVGILKAMKQTYDVLRKPNTDLTRADVIMSVARALMGTGMGAIAYWLADKGALFGRSNKDPEVRKLMQGTGVKDFQINGSALTRMLQAVATGKDVDNAAKLQPGDTLWAYQWAQPSSMPAAIGSNIYQSVKDKQGALQTAGEAALAGATTLLDSSVLSGIREIFQIPPGEDNVFKAVGMNLIKQLPSQFVPSMARQFNVLFDDKQRETYAMKGDTLGSITNYAESTIPGLAQQMPQRVSTLGEPQTKPNSFFDVFLSPAARSKYTPTPESQLVIDLLNETGDKNLAPRAVAKYVSGKDAQTGITRKVDLTPEQYVELQTIVGQETANRLKKIDPNWTTERKIEKVLEAFDEAGKIGRNKIKKDVGLKQTR